jgi:hypothetical protein
MRTSRLPVFIAVLHLLSLLRVSEIWRSTLGQVAGYPDHHGFIRSVLGNGGLVYCHVFMVP